MHSSKRFWRGLFFLLLITALCGGLALPVMNTPARAAPQMQTPATNIVISEFRTTGPSGGNDEFIEIFNPTSLPVDIGDWEIWGSNGNNPPGTGSRVRITAGTVLAPGEYYLIANNGYSNVAVPADQTYGTGVTDNGGIALTAAGGTPIIDQVGMSNNSAYKEGTTLSPLSGTANQSYERKIAGIAGNCSDTNNNASDFVLSQSTSNPQNSSTPPTPCIVVTNVTSSAPDGTYTVGANIDISIVFSDVVNVTGSPTLLLETGVTDRNATFDTGNGTNTLTFNYIVTTGDSSGDLDYVSVSALSGGSITSAVGTVILTLPSPGSPGSLGANKAIVIDNGISPSIVSFTRQTPSAQATNADSLVFRVTFNEAVTNVDPTDFIATGTTGTLTVNPVSLAVYDVTISGGDLSSLNGPVGLNLSQTQNIFDATGNSLPTTEPTTDQTYTLDNVAPTVTINQATGQVDPTTSLPISFTVVFSEPINVSTLAVADITQTGTVPAAQITWAITNPSSDQRNFVLQATAVSGAGTLVPSIAAGRVTDLAGNNNTASTSTDNSVTYNDTPTTGSANSVVISEFRTRGPGGGNDEFVEIYNPTANPVDISNWILSASNVEGSVQNRATIPAGTLLRSGQYYLFAHNSYIVPSGGVSPNLRYGTSIPNDGGVAILNASGDIIDQVGMSGGSFYQEGETLPAFSGTSNGSYERLDGGDLDSCVDTDDNENDFQNSNSSSIHNYSSPLSLCGTDRPALISSTTLITGDTPDPSTINGNVVVSVRVTGTSLSPSGSRVYITGANTNCTITLNSSGTGSCLVKFTTNGTKTITATYLGDNTHQGSSDTETHTVGTATTIRTPTRVPTAVPPPPLIVINEFVPRPGHDWNNDGVINTDDEYIELLNHGVVDVNLSGYTLDDEVNIGSAPFRLPSVTLRPGERRVFYGSETGLLLSDGGDGVRLLKPNGQLGDAYNYRVVRFPDQSYCRLPDNGGADDWNQNCFPTPGLQNSLSGSTVNPPTSGDAENLCPIADTLPIDFVFAECPPFGNNIWNPAYWDRNGWYGERNLPQSPGKWNVFVD